MAWLSSPFARRRRRRPQRRLGRLRRIAIVAGGAAGASVAWSQIRERRPALAAARRAYIEARRGPVAQPPAAVPEVPVETQEPVVDTTVAPVEDPAPPAPPGDAAPPAAPIAEEPQAQPDPARLRPHIRPAPASAPPGPAEGPSAEIQPVPEIVAEPTGDEGLDAAAARPPAAPSLVTSLVVPFALIALAAAAFVVAELDWSSPVRAVVVVGFVVVGPGWAILHLAGQSSGWIGASLVVALSVSVAVLVCVVMLGTGTWSPLGWLGVLAGATVLASLAAVVRSLSGRRHTAATMASAPT